MLGLLVTKSMQAVFGDDVVATVCSTSYAMSDAGLSIASSLLPLHRGDASASYVIVLNH
jgi:hypothetical protein